MQNSRNDSPVAVRAESAWCTKCKFRHAHRRSDALHLSGINTYMQEVGVPTITAAVGDRRAALSSPRFRVAVDLEVSIVGEMKRVKNDEKEAVLAVCCQTDGNSAAKFSPSPAHASRSRGYSFC